MTENILAKYRAYAGTTESYAVLFVKQHLEQSKGYWIDISDYWQYDMSSDAMHFKLVTGGLYQRKIKPQYPPKSAYTRNGGFDEQSYYLMVRAITWETAHKDITQQKLQRIRPLKFEIKGVSYDKNKNIKGYFRDDAPAEIKALEKNINDRTDILWNIALQYTNEPEFIYKIQYARLIK